MPISQLHRVRWAVRATLALGVAASVVANVLHARDNPISQAIAAWPPLALLLTVELISRVPVHRRSLAVARMIATATIAGIAAWVSYWHMVGVAARYGETGASPYLLPLSVDGLIVVASICLVELGGRIAMEQRQSAARGGAALAQDTTARAEDPVAQPGMTPAPGGAPVAVPAAATGSRTYAVGGDGASTTTPNGGGAPPKAVRSAKPAKAATSAPAAARRPRRSVTETAALAAAIEADRPHATVADVAQELGITPARLRAVRRQVRELELAA